MLKGDLASTPLAPLLLDLADDTSTGCLHITESGGDEALVYFKSGLVYAVSVPGSRPQLGAKLVSSGALAPEALSEALEAQRSELQGWRLGELLVHLGYVEQPVVEAFVSEQVSEALWDLMRWSDGQWKFRKNIKAREDVGPPMVVVELLEALRVRGYEWETISAVVHGPSAIPMLSARSDSSAELTLDNDAWSMLCKIDGERSVADLARDCGYTLFEAGHVIVSLVQAGLVDIDEDIDVRGSDLYGATTLSSALAGELDDDESDSFDPSDSVEEDAMSKLARLVTEVTTDHLLDDDDDDDFGGPERGEKPIRSRPAASTNSRFGGSHLANSMIVPLHRQSNESFAASMARVSTALSDVLGDAPEETLTPEEMQRRAAARRRSIRSNAPHGTSTSDPEWQRRKRLRSAAAAELASAQELVETLRPGQRHDETGLPGEIPKVVSAETERRRAAEREVEQAARRAAEQEVRAAAEQFAKAAADEAERHAAEQAAQRLAAEQAEQEAEEKAAAKAAATEAAEVAADEAARLKVEIETLEEGAWTEYWLREEAERQAVEEAAAQRTAEEAARRVIEEAAAEEAAAEAERIAAEEAAAEAERIAAEEAAAEAERLTAEEAEAEQAAEIERVAAEQAAAEAEQLAAEEAAAEAERLAAEQAAAEQAAAEAERVAAEEAAAEAERVAAEEAAAEAERLAAEQAAAEQAAAEAERVAAEEAAAEAERLAAEQAAAEAEQLAAEEAAAEAERIAAEQAAAEEERLAAEQAAAEQAAEAERLAAEQAAAEAERIAAEQAAAEEAAEAERQAAAKAERLAVEEAERLAAAAEVARLAAEVAEQERLAAEAAEAERLEAEVAAAEAERQAAAEAERLEAEHGETDDGEHSSGESRSERAARRKAEKIAAEEAAAQADQAASASALLIELASKVEADVETEDDADADANADADAETAPQSVEDDAVATDEIEHTATHARVDEEDDNDLDPPLQDWSDAGRADTAALLRELSSLGVDDAPPRTGAPAPARPTRAPTPDKKVKKKIGLFGL